MTVDYDYLEGMMVNVHHSLKPQTGRWEKLLHANVPNDDGILFLYRASERKILYDKLLADNGQMLHKCDKLSRQELQTWQKRSIR